MTEHNSRATLGPMAFQAPKEIDDQVFRVSPFEFDQTMAVRQGSIRVSPESIVVKAEKASQTIIVRATVGAK